MDTLHIERRQDRRALARDAGLGSVSGVSVLAGTLAAYALTAALVAIAGGIATLVNNGSNFSNLSSGELKVTGAIVVAVALFLSFLFGSYVAGRMARRSGALNGLAVVVLGLILGAGIGIWVKEAGGGPSLRSAMRDLGAPTAWHQWRAVGPIVGAAALVAMIIGSMLGGAHGERWHTKLVKRALDPTVGPEAAGRTSATPVERQVAQRPAPVEPDLAEQQAAVEPVAPVAAEKDSEDRSSWRHLLHH